jgi:hypothetical protein
MICFVINRFNEPDAQVQSVIDRVRLVYPNAVIQLNDDRVGHLKTPANGGQWTHRYLKFSVASGCEHIIKIDPDTTVLKAVENLPLDDCIFCRVKEHDLGTRIFRVPAGGALGFTREMARKIVDNGYFLHPRYRNNPMCNNFNDLMLMDILHRENLPMVDRPDFCCAGRPQFDGASFFHE